MNGRCEWTGRKRIHIHACKEHIDKRGRGSVGRKRSILGVKSSNSNKGVLEQNEGTERLKKNDKKRKNKKQWSQQNQFHLRISAIWSNLLLFLLLDVEVPSLVLHLWGWRAREEIGETQLKLTENAVNEWLEL